MSLRRLFLKWLTADAPDALLAPQPSPSALAPSVNQRVHDDSLAVKIRSLCLEPNKLATFLQTEPHLTQLSTEDWSMITKRVVDESTDAPHIRTKSLRFLLEQPVSQQHVASWVLQRFKVGAPPLLCDIEEDFAALILKTNVSRETIQQSFDEYVKNACVGSVLNESKFASSMAFFESLQADFHHPFFMSQQSQLHGVASAITAFELLNANRSSKHIEQWFKQYQNRQEQHALQEVGGIAEEPARTLPRRVL
jgi:hypothetical protein